MRWLHWPSFMILGENCGFCICSQFCRVSHFRIQILVKSFIYLYGHSFYLFSFNTQYLLAGGTRIKTKTESEEFEMKSKYFSQWKSMVKKSKIDIFDDFGLEEENFQGIAPAPIKGLPTIQKIFFCISFYLIICTKSHENSRKMFCSVIS